MGLGGVSGYPVANESSGAGGGPVVLGRFSGVDLFQSRPISPDRGHRRGAATYGWYCPAVEG